MSNARARIAVASVLVAMGIAARPSAAGRPSPPPPPAALNPAIAFVDTSLYVMDADGVGRTQVLLGGTTGKGKNMVSHGTHASPDWSPDGMDLVFASTVLGNGVYTIHRDGTDLVRIADVASVNLAEPEWSPAPVPGSLGGSRHRIVYAHTEPPNIETELYLCDPDGSDPVQVTTTPGVGEESPTWSPTGDRIAFALYTAASVTNKKSIGVYEFATDTYMTLAPGGGLAAPNMTVLKVEWSKTSGTELLVRSSDGNQQDIWILDITDLAHPVQLTSTASVGERWPSASHDDSKIVFSADFVIETMNFDGTGRTSLGVSGGHTAWRRNP